MDIFPNPTDSHLGKALWQEQILEGMQKQNHMEKWRKETIEEGVTLKEDMAEESDLLYTTWRTLRKLRAGVSRCKINMLKWRLLVG